MSRLSDGAAQVKRDFVLDLLELERSVEAGDQEGVTVMSYAVAVRACRLTDAGINWREHKVRSKRYRGKLGELYDKFKQHFPKGVRQV